MDDLMQKMEEARRHIQVEWDEDHAALLMVGVRRRARRRTIARAGAVIAPVAIAAIAGSALRGSGLTGREDEQEIATAPIPVVAVVEEERMISLGDGSTVTPLTPDSKIVLRQIAPQRIDVDFDAGSGRFDVLSNPERSFVVSVGDVRIVVLGSAFTLERTEDRTRVAVDGGRVRVEWPEGSRELGAGEAGWFPPEETWRELAQRGDYPRAYRELSPKAPSVRDEAEELLMAADVARLSGHPGEALPFLRAIVDRHASDPRAPLAAFMLGRVLADLGRHRDSAQSFSDARRLDPEGSLAEDALVREIESWLRINEREIARRRGEEYFARHPDGRRADDVRLLLQ